jgi:hypothetical protein
MSDTMMPFSSSTACVRGRKGRGGEGEGGGGEG